MSPEVTWRAGPRERLRLGGVGVARIALDRVLPSARFAQRVEVVAIASRDLAKARRAADQLAIPRAYGSYDALLRDADVDAVYNPLPNSLHAPWTIAAAEAGKHVLCEKPLAVSTEEARRMVDACRRNGVVVMDAFMYRHHPQHRVAFDLLRREGVGRLRHIRASFTYLHTSPRGNVRFAPELAGGALMDVGCYAINLARWAAGEEPLSVHAVQRESAEFGVDVSVSMLLEFPGGLAATLDAGFDRIGGGTYELVAERGTVTVPDAFTPAAHPVAVTLKLSDRSETVRVDPAHQYSLELDHFAESVFEGALKEPAEDGLANTAVVEAARRSMQERRRVLIEAA